MSGQQIARREPVTVGEEQPIGAQRLRPPHRRIHDPTLAEALAVFEADVEGAPALDHRAGLWPASVVGHHHPHRRQPLACPGAEHEVEGPRILIGRDQYRGPHLHRIAP
jgi:hypothetical protein